jgi:hypothetical protein
VNPEKSDTAAMLLVGVVAVLLVAANMGGCSNSDSGVYSPAPDRGSSDYRYVEKRMQLEGMSAKESRQAADAVIKFHNAQKNR